MISADDVRLREYALELANRHAFISEDRVVDVAEKYLKFLTGN